MRSVVQLLAGRKRANQAAVFGALPPQFGVADPQASAQAHDRRQKGAGAGPVPPSRRGVVSFTPGVAVGAGSGDLLAESIVLRGARCQGAAMTVREAAAALDESLLQEGSPRLSLSFSSGTEPLWPRKKLRACHYRPFVHCGVGR